jgi:hypothetical protein
MGLSSLTPEIFRGTAYGLTVRETGNYVQQCGGRVQLFNEFPCLEFLRNLFESNAQ